MSEHEGNPPPAPEDPNDVLQQSFLEFIGTRWVSPVLCPVCRTGEWTTLNAVDLPFRYVEGRVLTVVPVECDNCHYTLFFNAVGAGLFDEAGDPKPSPDL